MKNNSPSSFQPLKEAVLKQAQSRLNIQKNFSDWSLQDNRDFKEDLEARCQSGVSEKWFYTHLKNESPKLPRLDVLNLLSRYCEYKNWDDFQQSAQQPHPGVKLQALKIGAGLGLVVLLTLAFWPRPQFVYLVFTDA